MQSVEKITCVIVDDEPVARRGLQRYVERVDFLSLVTVCEDAMQLNTLLQTSSPDLLFLDIEMPYLSGLDLLATLACSPRVIITSAYEKYALRGYELDVADYLLKPFSFERFLKAVNKVRHSLLLSTPPLVPPTPLSDYLFVRVDRCLHKVFFKDILFVEGMENYVCIYFEDGETSRKVLVRSTLRRIVETLPEERFLQVHKSYVVNLEKVLLIDGNRLRIGTHTVSVARNFREELQKRIEKYLL